MNDLEAIKFMSDDSAISYRKLSERMGKFPTFVSSTVNRGSSPSVDNFVKMAKIMGYDVVLKGNGEEIQLEARE